MEKNFSKEVSELTANEKYLKEALEDLRLK